MNSKIYLGFDFSTQQVSIICLFRCMCDNSLIILQVKALATDENFQIIHEASVQFDTDLPEFKTEGDIVSCYHNIYYCVTSVCNSFKFDTSSFNTPMNDHSAVPFLETFQKYSYKKLTDHI